MTDAPALWEECERRIAILSSDPDVEWVNVIDLADEIKKAGGTPPAVSQTA